MKTAPNIYYLFLAIVLILTFCGCSGIRKNDQAFYAHASSVRLFGYHIPDNDLEVATSLVPKKGDIETINSTPSDWTSVLGVLSNILWIGTTEISGTYD